MSRKLVTLIYERKVGSAHRKAILANLADKASDNGKGVWASKRTIAQETECGRSTVIKTINEFVSEGLLEVSGTRPCKNGETVVYDMNVDAIRALPEWNSEAQNSFDPSVSGTSPDLDRSTSGTLPVHQRDPKGSTSGTQTVLEPSMNHSPNGEYMSAGEVNDALIAYNEAAGRQGWPMVQKFSPERRKRLKDRLREAGGMTGWVEALAKAEASDFICGRTDRPWSGFGLDALTRPAIFTKLMEGNYDNRTRNNGNRSGTVEAFAAVAAKRAARH